MAEYGRRRTPKPPISKSSSPTFFGQYGNPVCVVAFNTAERWSQDVSEDVAQEIRRRCDLEGRELPSSVQDFVDRHAGDAGQLTLRLVRPG